MGLPTPDDTARPHPQFFHHCPHRPRQIDPGGPLHPALPGPDSAGNVGPGARLDGPGARAGHHHQGAKRVAALPGPRRHRVPAELHRHPRSCRFLLRGIALAGRLRGRAAGGRRRAGRGSADRRQLLHGHRAGSRSAAGAEQNRPADRRAGAGQARDRGNRRHRRRRRRVRERQDRPRAWTTCWRR